ncbi:MAG: DUF4426 domain-containing protein [Pseudomonadales bacterium]|nr:DUF4426 domain-containing protein [Pseudomonadales bacterium]
MTKMIKIKYLPLICFLLAVTPNSAIFAEQYFSVGTTKAHYVVLNTMFLTPKIANQYGIARGNDRAIINISLMSESGTAQTGVLSGQVKNLLGQLQTLEFKEIVENEAVYYIAPLVYTNRDTLKFEINVLVPGQPETMLEFRNRMYLNTDN